MFAKCNNTIPLTTYSRSIFLAFCIMLSTDLAAQCTVSSSPLNFPPYDIFDGAPAQSSSELLVVCDPDIPYAIKFSPGLNATGDFSNRQMLSTSVDTPLKYNIYLDAGHNRIWGDGTGFSQFYSATGNGRTEIVPVFGRIPPAQRVQAGTYSDTIVITVEW